MLSKFRERSCGFKTWMASEPKEKPHSYPPVGKPTWEYMNCFLFSAVVVFKTWVEKSEAGQLMTWPRRQGIGRSWVW